LSPKELQNIITAGENETTEFKSSFNKEVIETIVAFSNHKGGRIIIGVNDKKEIKGISLNSETIQNWINEIKQNTIPSIFPDIELHIFEKKHIALIEVNEYPLKPIAFKDRYFIRKNNSNHKLRNCFDFFYPGLRKRRIKRKLLLRFLRCI
jgi:ATP-dependent DNA helicase RecG